jgi:hypothetical protein
MWPIDTVPRSSYLQYKLQLLPVKQPLRQLAPRAIGRRSRGHRGPAAGRRAGRALLVKRLRAGLWRGAGGQQELQKLLPDVLVRAHARACRGSRRAPAPA